ncbi:MAG: PAS domain S-box protein [bacterium]
MRMSKKTKILLLAALMVIPTCLVALIGMRVLYNRHFDQQRVRLTDAVQTRVYVIESALGLSPTQAAVGRNPVGTDSASLRQTLTWIEHGYTQYQVLGSSYETMLARENGNLIEYVLSNRYLSIEEPEPILTDSKTAEPMKRALDGEYGTLIYRDYHGHEMLAAYAPVTVLRMGVVVMIRVDEIRAPYVKAGLWSAVILLLLFIILGATAFRRVVNSIFQSLEDGERRYRNLFELSNDAVIIHDTSGKILDVNRRACEMLAYSREQMLAMTVLDLHPEQSAANAHKALSLMKRQPSVQFESSFVRSDLSEVDIEISASVIDAALGTVQGIVRDITQRRLAEASMRESEEKFRTLFEASADAVMLLDESGFFDCNAATLQMFGCRSKEEFCTKTPADVSPPWQPCGTDSITLAQKHIATAMENGSHRFEWDHQRLNGDIFTVQVLLTCMPLKGANVLQATVRDITEQKEAEQAVRESEQKYRGLVENLNLGVAVISPKMEVLSTNAMMQSWFPNVDPAIRPKCYAGFNDPPRDNVCEYCPTVKTLLDGRVHEAITETPTGDRIRNFRVVASPIKNEHGSVTAVIETVEEITDKIKMEHELARADKLESIGVLAGGIAHDFNNMLTAMLGNISLARGRLGSDSIAEPLLAAAEVASMRAQGLTMQLLTFAKGGKPVKETASVGQVVLDSAAFALRGSHLKCTYDIEDDLNPSEIDVGQVGQVISNLVLNASQAMPDGGTLKVSCRNEEVDNATTMPLEAGSYVVVAVTDTGTGISAENLEKIFDPFFTTKAKGNGLGLASCYSIVRHHGGHIQVDSEIGVGSTFTVYLPASTSRTPGEIKSSVAPVRGAGRILVMDDEEAVRTMAAMMLEDLGYEATTSADGQEAVDLYLEAQQALHPFHAVILDLTIPGGLGGKEVIGYLKRINPNVKAIVSSGYSNDPVLANHSDYGFSGVVTKPYRLADLGRVLNDVVGVYSPATRDNDQPVLVATGFDWPVGATIRSF